jgi:menaquinol-cytochrome c reductase iron-sulfur subunit
MQPTGTVCRPPKISPKEPTMPPSPSNDRRGFLAIVLAGAALAVPAVAGVLGFLNPWRKRVGENDQSGGLIRVASLAEVGDSPKEFPVISERFDAWTHSVEPVGTVFLRRTSDGQVLALQVKCPHEACALALDGEKGIFACTCHSAKFHLDGTRIDPDKSMSPRDMDSLEAKIIDEQVWVEYREFRTGTTEKAVKT